MKHIISLFTLLMIAMTIQAQEHLSFMDVPIDGPLDKMVGSLQERGFIYRGNLSKNIAHMGYDINGQLIDVYLNADDNDNVYQVSIHAQPKVKWNVLKREYGAYKKDIVKQYGEPTAYEGFLPPYDTKKKIRRHQLEALLENRAYWNSFFATYGSDGTKTGDIMLSISPYAHLARVSVYYLDAINAPDEERNEIDN